MTRFNTMAFVLACIVCATLASVANAATQTWDAGAVTQEWNTAANWTNDAFPNDATSDAFVFTNVGLFPIITANSVFTPRDIRVGSVVGNGRLDHRSGSVSLFDTSSSGGFFMVGQGGGTGTYNLADTTGSGGALTGFAQGSGSLTVGKLFVGGAYFTGAGTGTININTSGTINANSTGTFSNHGGVSLIVGTLGGNGTLNIDNGTVNAAGIVDVASATANNQATQGTLNIGSGGTLNSEGNFRTAFAGSSGAQATVTLSGGTLNVGSTLKRWMELGHFDNGSSTINVNSGNLNLNTNTDIRFKTNGGSGTHIINLNGGAITSYSDNMTTANGAGVVDLMYAGSSANNTFNLNGGTLTIRQVITTNNGSTATLNFNGGTLKATGDTVNFVDLGGGSQRVNIRNNGAFIHTNGFDVTIPEALQHSNIGGDNTIDGGLTKNGLGTLTLSAINTYNGGTTVNDGTLSLTAGGATGTIRGTLTINSGATVQLNATDALGYNNFGGVPVTQINITEGTLNNNVTGNNSASASWTLEGGTMSSTGGGSFHIGFFNANTITSNASATQSTISGNVVLRNGINLPITVADGAAATDLLISGDISDNAFGEGNAGITKAGAGVLRLTGNNTYAGLTDVNAGALIVDGTHTGGGLYTVAAGATLGGSGMIDAPVDLFGTVSPGNSPETLSTGSETWNDGSDFLFEIDNALGTAGGDTPNGGWDRLDITGSLDLSNLSAGGFTIDIDSLLHPSHTPGELAVENLTQYIWDFVHTTDGITDFDPSLFAFDTSGFSSSIGGRFDIRQTGNNLELVFTTPEPAALAIWTMLGLALGGYGYFRIRRKK